MIESKNTECSLEENLGISDKHSWKMFRGSSMRTGVSASNISRKPSLLWVTEVGPVVSSPLFEEGMVYVSSITGRIFALNLSKKEIKWCLNVGSPIVSTPLLHNQILLVATYDSWVKGTAFAGKNFLFGIDRENGKEIWKFETLGNVFSSPCIVDDTITIIGSLSNAVFALQGNSGDLLWKFETGGQVWSSPSYNGSKIFIGSDDGFLYCLDQDGKLLWKTKLNGKIRSSSPCLSFYEESPSVFIGTYSGGIYCLSQLTGKIKWRKQINQPVMASPGIIKDKAFFAASDNKIYCLQKNDGSKVWDFETGGKIWSSPSISEYDNVLFLGSLDAHIYGIDIDTGKHTWKFPTMSMIDSSAAIANNMIFMASRDGLLYVFGSEMTPTYIG
jgi:outer membrane protein assembly factor BamB